MPNLPKTEKLRVLELSRKPNTFKEARTVNVNDPELTEIIYDLPCLELKLENPFSDLPKDTPQWFVLNRGFGKTERNYLVNTEGYEYCRYVGRLGKLAYKENSELLKVVSVFG